MTPAQYPYPGDYQDRPCDHFRMDFLFQQEGAQYYCEQGEREKDRDEPGDRYVLKSLHVRGSTENKPQEPSEVQESKPHEREIKMSAPQRQIQQQEKEHGKKSSYQYCRYCSRSNTFFI